jgi:hypothetical protein
MVSESNILQLCRLKCSQLGKVMFRNNTGKLKDINGRLISFGLCVGSSDLIGYTSKIITADMIGKTIAIFTAYEVKKIGGKPTKEQQIFIDNVNKAGGVAKIIYSPDEI